MRHRTILDLCGGTGAWSQPYRYAGYSTLIVDPKAIELPNGQTYRGTVKEFNEELERDRVKPHFHGVLAAPPCTEFAVSGARWWKSKPPELLAEAVKVVMQCLWATSAVEPIFWALENPVGRLHKYIGRPKMTFQPWEFGDPWTKKTCLWGHFYSPTKIDGARKPEGTGAKRWQRSLTNHLSPKPTAAQIAKLVQTGMLPPDWIHRLGPSPERATLRSITPPGFARAFFEANP
jgi:site-specific DNA-cytosine methylase